MRDRETDPKPPNAPCASRVSASHGVFAQLCAARPVSHRRSRQLCERPNAFPDQAKRLIRKRQRPNMSEPVPKKPGNLFGPWPSAGCLHESSRQRPSCPLPTAISIRPSAKTKSVTSSQTGGASPNSSKPAEAFTRRGPKPVPNFHRDKPKAQFSCAARPARAKADWPDSSSKQI